MENKSMIGKDKIRILGIVIVTLLLASTLVIFAVTLIKRGKPVGALFPGITLILVLVFMIPFVKRRYFDVKKGFPYEDERSKKIMLHASAKAYLLSVWWILAIGWMSNQELIEFRDVSQATGAGMLGMAVLFGLSYLYVNWRGEIE